MQNANRIISPVVVVYNYSNGTIQQKEKEKCIMMNFSEFLKTYCMETEIQDVYLYKDKMYHVDELVAVYEMIDCEDEKSEYWWMNY